MPLITHTIPQPASDYHSDWVRNNTAEGDRIRALIEKGKHENWFAPAEGPAKGLGMRLIELMELNQVVDFLTNKMPQVIYYYWHRSATWGDEPERIKIRYKIVVHDAWDRATNRYRELTGKSWLRLDLGDGIHNQIAAYRPPQPTSDEIDSILNLANGGNSETTPETTNNIQTAGFGKTGSIVAFIAMASAAYKLATTYLFNKKQA